MEVDRAESTFAVILNRTIKNWGADSGANEKGVTISVSWATTNEKALLATELARYGWGWMDKGMFILCNGY